MLCRFSYALHRYYNPTTGRFNNEDPLGRWFDVRALGNGFQWAGGRYRNRWDPLGLYEWSAQEWQDHLDAQKYFDRANDIREDAVETLTTFLVHIGSTTSANIRKYGGDSTVPQLDREEAASLAFSAAWNYLRLMAKGVLLDGNPAKCNLLNTSKKVGKSAGAGLARDMLMQAIIDYLMEKEVHQFNWDHAANLLEGQIKKFAKKMDKAASMEAKGEKKIAKYYKPRSPR